MEHCSRSQLAFFAARITLGWGFGSENITTPRWAVSPDRPPTSPATAKRKTRRDRWARTRGYSRRRIASGQSVAAFCRDRDSLDPNLWRKCPSVWASWTFSPFAPWRDLQIALLRLHLILYDKPSFPFGGGIDNYLGQLGSGAASLLVGGMQKELR